MRKLLSANSFRLRRHGGFRAVAWAMLLWGMFVCGMMLYNHRNSLDISGSVNIHFFHGNLWVGLAIAIFAASFIGQQHMEGGLRNMLIVGHSRFVIYLANLAICFAAGILFLMAFWLGYLLVGLPGMGAVVLTGLEQPLYGIVWSYTAVLGYSALFCLVAMLDSSKSRAAVVCLLLAAFLLVGGFAIRSGLEQPEFTTRFVTDDLVNFVKEETIPNPRFLQGTKRTVYECLDALLPSCQALHPVVNTEYPLSHPLWAAVWAVSLTVAGECLFRKKNIQ